MPFNVHPCTSPALTFDYLQNAVAKRLAKSIAYAGFAAVFATAAATAQVASPNTAGLDTSGNPRSEAATCRSGKTQQDRRACMLEVRNANAEKRAGKLGAGGNFASNAMRRCEVFKDTDALAACRARVESEAALDGSVGSGGVIRQTETVVPAVPQ